MGAEAMYDSYYSYQDTQRDIERRKQEEQRERERRAQEEQERIRKMQIITSSSQVVLRARKISKSFKISDLRPAPLFRKIRKTLRY